MKSVRCTTGKAGGYVGLGGGCLTRLCQALADTVVRFSALRTADNG
ncbi:MAG: hypothetical protein ACP5I8_03150 [Phycisphaerae bacterium]